MRPTILTCALLMLFCSLLRAQSPDRWRVQLLGGMSLPGDIRSAYNAGRAARLGIGIDVTERVSVRGNVEFHSFTFDRERFFAALGIYDVDLSTQLGGYADALLVSTGLEWAPWKSRVFRPYLVAGLAYLRRNSDAVYPLVSLYCHAPTFIVRTDPVTGETIISVPVDWVPPDHCSQAWKDADVGGSELAFETGVGLEFALPGHHAIAVETRLVRGVGATSAVFFPVQAGFALRF